MVRRSLSEAYKRKIREMHNHRCTKCGTQDNIHVHHIIAVMDGGSDDPENLTTLCSTCHKEWHVLEEASDFSFEKWLEYPPLRVILAALEAKIDDQATVKDFKESLFLFTRIYNFELPLVSDTFE